MKGSTSSLAQASLRDADLPAYIPWAEAHGYHREVAPRLFRKWDAPQSGKVFEAR